MQDFKYKGRGGQENLKSEYTIHSYKVNEFLNKSSDRSRS